MNLMTATTMPEAIRQNRTNLEIGHPPAASSVFGEWTRSEQRADSSQNSGGSWDGLDPARLEDGTAPRDIIRRAGQQTGMHPKS
jgi:hypothetical protein